MSAVRVIAIDGPSASGKGTVAERVAQALGFHYLDSGAIYRAVALAMAPTALGADADENRIAAVAAAMQLRFADGKVWLGAEDVTSAIRSEECGANASRIAALPLVRAALLQRQRDFRVAPGLVGDGRDMASVIFPDAALKVFLTATAEERAFRRVAQLQGIPLKDAKGLIENENNAKLILLFDSVLADLQERDRRDAARATAPLKQVEGAKLLETTNLSVDQAVKSVLGWFRGIR